MGTVNALADARDSQNRQSGMQLHLQSALVRQQRMRDAIRQRAHVFEFYRPSAGHHKPIGMLGQFHNTAVQEHATRATQRRLAPGGEFGIGVVALHNGGRVIFYVNTLAKIVESGQIRRHVGVRLQDNALDCCDCLGES